MVYKDLNTALLIAHSDKYRKYIPFHNTHNILMYSSQHAFRDIKPILFNSSHFGHQTAAPHVYLIGHFVITAHRIFRGDFEVMQKSKNPHQISSRLCLVVLKLNRPDRYNQPIMRSRYVLCAKNA
ncbi:hypothetical protein L798_03281 [Zootermopsis nevadensis]|uniref:Uncharacterized protein n=1 Tax=Zootermopsis nevadensis TaxID=136037 RepID=A0A067RDY2_ZOONE|nr:hypothetical protein L798_03281 [Zootermopsis nevadensis]